jgi:surface carbohydrate biosynthesis protein (TIGR04326 family)
MQQAVPHARHSSHAATDRVAGAALLLWAGEIEAVPPHDNILLWQGGAPRCGVRSLTELIDLQADEIRRRYLAWSFDLGEVSVDGRRLCQHFRRAHGTSFWWQSLFVEQSTWKQRSLERLLKMFVLELLLERETLRELTFAGADRDIHRVLRCICRRRGIRYRWVRLPRVRAARRGVLRALPRSVQGLLALAWFATIRVALGRPPRLAPTSGVGRILIYGAFANHNAGRHTTSEFSSRFWGSLPEVLVREGYDVRWLHYFYAHDRVPTARRARQILQRINAQSARGPVHAFVESYLPLGALVQLCGRWMKIAWESLRVGRQLRRRFTRGECGLYWPLIRDDWAKAFRGFDCVQNLFYDACIDRVLASPSKYDEGVYLMENQGWERALADAWRRHGHGRLTAVAHSTVRFWDLRYHCDPRRYHGAGRERPVAPDCVALNGRVAHEEYVATCAAREPLLDCEALRYLHLAPSRPRDLGELSRGGILRILVLGDYTRERTDALLRVTERICGAVGGPLEILVKPHPGCPVATAPAHPAVRIVGDAVAGLVASAHFVVASNTTSAALEAYVSGGRLFVLDDGSGVNYSPLRRVPGVSFVRNAEEICRAIAALDPGASEPPPQTDGFFYIDPELPRWRRYFATRRGAARSSVTAPQELTRFGFEPDDERNGA